MCAEWFNNMTPIPNILFLNKVKVKILFRTIISECKNDMYGFTFSAEDFLGPTKFSLH